jgi:hypothetical protein
VAPDRIKAAFDQHTRQSSFFPKPAEILDLVYGDEARSAEQRFHDREAGRTEQMLRESRERREYVATHPEEAKAIADMVKQAAERVKSIPHLVPAREPARSPRNVLALSQSKVLKHV